MNKNIIYPLEDQIGFVSLVDRMQEDVALKVVNSARVSYGKKKAETDEKDRQLTTFLAEHGHTSPFRHSYFTFHIKLPLFVARQWMKYQVGSCWRTYEVDGDTVSLEVFEHQFDTDTGCSWNEISGRYVGVKPEFYFPRAMRGNAGHADKQQSSELDWPQDTHDGWYDEILDEYERIYITYLEMLDVGIAKEIARMVLPQAMYTEVYWTVSLQGVIHFLKQRLDEHAQFEIRKYAVAIKNILKDDLDRLGIEL